jgi:hypothetical protein
MQLHVTYKYHSTLLGSVFVTLKHVPCAAPEDHKIFADEEQNYV